MVLNRKLKFLAVALFAAGCSTAATTPGLVTSHQDVQGADAAGLDAAVTPTDAEAADTQTSDVQTSDAQVSDAQTSDSAPQPDIAPGGPCKTADDCPTATPYCGAGTCAACLSALHCPGSGARCVGHACKPALPCASDKDCTPSGAVCDQSAGICRECLSVNDCPSGLACKNNLCVPDIACKSSKECPDQLVCAGGNCAECAVDADCAVSQFCSGGHCYADVCKPGATCVAGKVSTCSANGSAVVVSDCPAQTICSGGACLAVVCAPAAKQCQDGQLATCSESGAGWVKAACPDKEVCVTDKCVPVVCKAGEAACKENGRVVCSGDGTSWMAQPCAGGAVCVAAGECKAVTCSPNTKSCDGAKVVLCDAQGIGTSLVEDCSTSAKSCAAGACISSLCVAGSFKCDGIVLSTCKADGMSWSAKSCDDGSQCTTDSCDAAGGKCVQAGSDCSDNNPCTLDTCDGGGCKHAGLSGAACDDGNACTSGEACVAGLCSAALGTPTVSTVAGQSNYGFVDGAGSSAKFYYPASIARLPDGSMAVMDSANRRIRKVSADGTVSTIAGTGTSGISDGAVASATFGSLADLAVDQNGTIYVVDTQCIRKIAGGQVTTVAGSANGNSGFKDGDGGIALFANPAAVAVDATGTLWIADAGNQRIRKMSPSGLVTTVAGSGTAGYVDGASASAQFDDPCVLTVGPDGSVIVGDCGNHRLRRIAADSKSVSTLAGAGNGFQDGAPTSALFASFGGLAYVGSTLFVGDSGNNRIRTIAPDGTVGTIAGSGTQGFVDGAASSATFYHPAGLAPDWNGAVWVADDYNHRIRKLKFPTATCNDGNPCTADTCAAGSCSFAAIGTGSACSDGSACTTGETCQAGACKGTVKDCGDGNLCTADFCNPATAGCEYVTLTGTCEDGDACTLAEHCSGGVCKSDVGALSTVAGGAASGFVDGSGKTAKFNGLYGVTGDGSGNLYLADGSNHRVRKMAADGTVTTLAGTGASGYLDGAASSAKFNCPGRIAVDAKGATIVVDQCDHRIRKIVGATVSTLAGSGSSGYLDGAPTSAQFHNPAGIALGQGGVLYIADRYNHRIRSIGADGNVGTFAGSGSSSTTDGAASSAGFAEPYGLCAGSDGTVYVTDVTSHTIRRIKNGQVDTFAGGTAGLLDGLGKAARFYVPADCAVDGSGNVYVADQYNNRLRRIDPAGNVTTLAGSGSTGNGNAISLIDGPTTTASLVFPTGVTMAGGGSVWIADNNAVRKFAPPVTDCDDGQACTLDTCNEKTGGCTFTPIASGGACDDGKPCTVGETCSGGSCGGGAVNTCDDANACTTDSCEANSGCVHTWQSALPGCCNPNVFTESFDSGKLTGWSLNSDYGDDPGWQVWSSASLVKSGKGVLYYGSIAGGDYASGTSMAATANAGTATSATIALPVAIKPTLHFWLYMATESEPKYDTLDVSIISGDKSTTMWTKSEKGFAKGQWLDVSIDLSQWSGKSIQVRFDFDTVDSTSNSGLGVLIDDVRVEVPCK